MGPKNVIKIIGSRFDYLENYVKKKFYHPERYLNYILKENNIKCKEINLKGKRVRANGKIKDEDFNV